MTDYRSRSLQNLHTEAHELGVQISNDRDSLIAELQFVNDQINAGVAIDLGIQRQIQRPPLAVIKRTKQAA